MRRRKELDTSQQSIEALIEHLDQEKDEAIERTFKQVSREFATIFEKLVPAGHGRLVIQRKADRGNKKGNAEVLTTRQAINFFGNAPQTLYLPGKADITRGVHETEVELMKIAKTNPTTGFFSDTNASKGASSTDTVYVAVKDIVAGRKPLSSFKKDILPTWQREAGNAMRDEFEKAIADSK